MKPLVPALAALLLAGCTVSQTAAPALRRQPAAALPSVGLVGFTSETVDANPYFGAASHSFSGTAYGRGGAVNYHGTGSSSFSGVTFVLLGVLNGASRRDRTDDLKITNQVLYQLSYAGVIIECAT